MTTEEKAKAYDEAMERARKYNVDGAFASQGTVAKLIFPELAESDDERIRGALVKTISEIAGNYPFEKHGITKKDALAFLEKQKEQKPVEKQDYSGLTDLERAIRRGFLCAGLENVPVTIIKETAQDCLSHIERPVEWREDYREEDIQTRFAFYTYKDDPSVLYLSNVFVEESSRNHGFGTRILRAAEKAAEAIGATTISLKVKQDSPANAWYRKNGYGYVAFEDGYDWLEKNLEYLKPKKSIEWSEEDEKTMKDLIDLLWIMQGSTNLMPGTASKYTEFLKSLRPQQNQEWNDDIIRRAIKEVGLTQYQIDWFKENVFPPKQEWSEEDEKMSISILNLLCSNLLCSQITYASGNGTITGRQIPTYANERDWFKKRIESLRPQSRDKIYKEKDEAYKLGKHHLAIKFMNYLDENRPEGKMSLSNGECEDIDKAFNENDWEKIMRYVDKYHPHWKPSEEQMEALQNTLDFMPETFKPKCTIETLYSNLKKL